MIVSLNPTYLCNFTCGFCYLTPEQLRDKKRLPDGKIYNRLSSIQNNYKEIEGVDLYGGEIGLYNEVDGNSLIDTICRVYDWKKHGKIHVTTNLSVWRNWYLREEVMLYVSYDGDARQDEEKVWNNMWKLGHTYNQDFGVLTLASLEFIRAHRHKDFARKLAMNRHIVSWELKPYSKNQANDLAVTHKDFEELVMQYVQIFNNGLKRNFQFENELQIVDSINRTNNSLSDDHIYITPNGEFAVLEFDDNDKEFFLHLDNMKDYIEWTKKEAKRNMMNPICASCQYYKSCLTEHLRIEPIDKSGSCNGYRELISWYKGTYPEKMNYYAKR